MTLILSKTDALGDQFFASGFVQTLLNENREGHLFWLIRQGYEVAAKLFSGSEIFFPDQSRSAGDESLRCLEFSRLPRKASNWNLVTFVPVPIDAYSTVHFDELVLANLEWWLTFVRGMNPDVAVAGSISLNWLDWAVVCGSGARTTAGCEDGDGRHEASPQLVQFLERLGGSDLRFQHAIPFQFERSELESFAMLSEVLTGRRPPWKFQIMPDQDGESRVREDSILIAPGAGDLLRSYPRSALREVVRILKSAGALEGHWVTILIGPKDKEVAEELSDLLTEDHIDYDSAHFDPFDLPELVASIRCSSLLICNETFYAHLAAILGTPTVAIWGEGHVRRFVPPSGNITILQVDIQCRGCGWNCIFDQRKCITSLEPRCVADACMERLQMKGAQEPLVLRSFSSPFTDAEIHDAFRSAIVKDAGRHRFTHSMFGSAVADLQKWIDRSGTTIEELKALVSLLQAQLASLREYQKRAEAELKSLREYRQVVEPEFQSLREYQKRAEAELKSLREYRQVAEPEFQFLREYRRQIDKLLSPFRKVPGFKWLVKVVVNVLRR
jgi:Glycosyltransferase family 9 (heptosyltransferase)